MKMVGIDLTMSGDFGGNANLFSSINLKLSDSRIPWKPLVNELIYTTDMNYMNSNGWEEPFFTGTKENILSSKRNLYSRLEDRYRQCDCCGTVPKFPWDDFASLCPICSDEMGVGDSTMEQVEWISKGEIYKDKLNSMSERNIVEIFGTGVGDDTPRVFLQETKRLTTKERKIKMENADGIGEAIFWEDEIRREVINSK